jgi:FMN phosphatase YigB (HAD superfamily)
MKDKQGSRRRYRAVLFDLPGTVICAGDNDLAHLHLMETLVERYGLNEEPVFLLEKFNARISEPYERLDKGWVSHRDTVTAVLGGLVKAHGIRVGPSDEERLYQEYLNKHQSFVRLVPGAAEMLGRCDSIGFHLAALGNMDPDYLEKQLGWLSVLERFDSITTPEEAGAPLPDPAMIRVALGRANAPPKQAIFVGASVRRGIVSAKRLGLTTVLLDVEMKQTELRSSDFVASHLTRVTNILIELAHQA